MERIVTPEIMDRPDVARDELAESLRYIRSVNARLGGEAALLNHLKRWSMRWPRDQPVTLLDIATGSADLPVAARRWALEAGFDLRITAIDLHPTTLDLAREHVGRELGDDPEQTGITLISADARELIEMFGPLSFDYVHAGLFLHHLPEIEVLTVLRIMERLARAGIIWNDLIRSRIGYLAICLMTRRSPSIIRHDARVSVLAGFTRREVREIQQRLSLQWCRYSGSLLTHRFTLAGEKPGAWVAPGGMVDEDDAAMAGTSGRREA